MDHIHTYIHTYIHTIMFVGIVHTLFHILAGLKSKKSQLEHNQRLLQQKIGHTVTGITYGNNTLCSSYCQQTALMKCNANVGTISHNWKRKRETYKRLAYLCIHVHVYNHEHNGQGEVSIRQMDTERREMDEKRDKLLKEQGKLRSRAEVFHTLNSHSKRPQLFNF